MTDPLAASQLAHRFVRAAHLSGTIVAVVGVIVLLGWAFGINELKRIQDFLASMKPNTALCFVLAGMSLRFLSTADNKSRVLRIARINAVLVIAIAVVTLSEYAFGWNPGIDELLFHDPASAQAPGRMAIATAGNFLLIGLALLTLDIELSGGWRPAQWCALLAATSTMLFIIGYVYGALSLHTIAPFASVALHTAAMTMLLAAGLLLARPRDGLVRLLASDTSSGIVARHMLPPIILIPIVAGWLELVGENFNLYPPEFGNALYTMVVVACLAGLMWWTGSRDIRLEEILREREAGLHRAQIMTKSAHVITRPDGSFESWSETLPELIGVSDDQVPSTTRKWLDIVHPDDRINLRDRCIAAGISGAHIDVEYRVRRTDGKWIELQAVLEPIRGQTGPDGKMRWFSTIQDVTEQKEQQRRIARLNRIYTVLSGINSAIVRIHDRNELLQEACRIAVNEGAFGMAWVGIIDPDTLDGKVIAWLGDDPGYIEKIRLTARPGTPDSDRPACVAVREMRPVICNDIRIEPGLALLKTALMERSQQSLAALPLIVGNRAVAVIALFANEIDFFDAEEVKLLDELAGDLSFGLQFIEKEEKLNYLAYYDALTGLPNNMLFHDRLTQFMHGTKHDQHIVAAIMLDLDHFSQLNDALGRHAGDALLRQVAKRLQASLREPYSLARISGDTFAIAVSDLQQGADAAAILEQQIFGTFNQPFMLDQQEIRISARAGLALFPGDGRDAETLFKHAEVALKKAQSTGEHYLYYAPQMNAAIAARLALEGELQVALNARQFVMYFQPRIDLRSGRIIGAEALIRWRHPERGLVPPLQFIPLAEETGLIVPIGAWAIDAVCAQQEAWLEQQIEIVPIAVNLSALQFKKGQVLHTIRDALAAHRLEHKYIEFELTESLVMENPEEAARNLRALKNMGLQLSLDDFGTGYSSLAYLKRFPFDFVKIDRAFVTDITQNPEDAVIASAIIAMAHSLNLRVVAEGVETEGQLRYLRKQGCDELQGYYFSPPVPAAAFEAMLREDKHLTFEQDPAQQTRTLLIVDDDANTLSALKRLLRQDDYHILIASSAQEGLELLSINQVQVIVSDQRMSGMSGSAFLSIVKELYPDTIRIILSGYTDLQEVTDGVNRGAIFKFLSKPWDDDLLRENIRDAFRRYLPIFSAAETAQQKILEHSFK